MTIKIRASKMRQINARTNMWVCEKCLMGIECHEGTQATMRHYVDEEDTTESRCDWCEEDGFDTLYELI